MLTIYGFHMEKNPSSNGSVWVTPDPHGPVLGEDGSGALVV